MLVSEYPLVAGTPTCQHLPAHLPDEGLPVLAHVHVIKVRLRQQAAAQLKGVGAAAQHLQAEAGGWSQPQSRHDGRAS